MSSYQSGSGYRPYPCLERVRHLEHQGFIQSLHRTLLSLRGENDTRIYVVMEEVN